MLLLVAPTLHIHPATDTVLRYFAPEIEWTLVGIDERWRDGVRVIPQTSQSAGLTTTAHRHRGSLGERSALTRSVSVAELFLPDP